MDEDNKTENIVTKKDEVKIRTASGEIKKFKFITNNYELDPSNGYISAECPLGQAILGARVHEKRRYKVGDNEFEIEILEVIKYKSESESKGKNNS